MSKPCRYLIAALVFTAASCGGGAEKPVKELPTQSEPVVETTAAIPAMPETKPAQAAGGGPAVSPAEPVPQAVPSAPAAASTPAASAAAPVAALPEPEPSRLSEIDVPAPSFTVPGGVYGAPVQIAIKSDVKEAMIAYTLDGSPPGPNSGIRYSGPFTLSAYATVQAAAFIPGGKTSPVAGAEYSIGELCVAPGASGIGSRKSPLGSLGPALAKARELGIRRIKLAAGTWRDSVSVDFQVHLSGGWDADFAVARRGRTVVAASSMGSTSKQAPGYALRVSGREASGSSFEGITFIGPESSYSSGVFITASAAPEFEACAFYAGLSGYGYGALVTQGASPSFSLCLMNGGEGTASAGLSVDGASAQVKTSLLSAGKGTTTSYGAVATGGSMHIANSVAAGNSANTSYGVAFYNSLGSRLENSTIVGGTGRDVSAVFISSSDPAVAGCVLQAEGKTKSYGINANYGESSPSSLTATVFLGCSGGVYFDAGLKKAYSSFDASGRIQESAGKPLAKPKGEGNSLGTFTLGPAPYYPAPNGKPGADLTALADIGL